MPVYAVLYQLTDQGARTVKEAPGRIEAGLKAAERMGSNTTAFYVCSSGEYDYISLGEWPNDEAAKAFLMALESLGNVRVKWTRVYEPAEFADLVAKLP